MYVALCTSDTLDPEHSLKLCNPLGLATGCLVATGQVRQILV